MKILVVEDEPPIADILQYALTDAGYAVLGPVDTLNEGLRVAEKNRPDLALVNINLKDGSKGTDLARELLNRWKVPCLFISGEMAEAEKYQDVALGYIAKPYKPSLVIESIEVAKAIIDGRPYPKRVPSDLKLFSDE